MPTLIEQAVALRDESYERKNQTLFLQYDLDDSGFMNADIQSTLNKVITRLYEANELMNLLVSRMREVEE